jgi:hypothetical protein
MNNRAKQLLRHGIRIDFYNEYDEGLEVFFKVPYVPNHIELSYKSIYVLEQHRGKGFFKKIASKLGSMIPPKPNPILTTDECLMEGFLKEKGYEYLNIGSVVPFLEYKLIQDFYGDQKAKRSGVYLMNHIEEGLAVLEAIGASELAKKAYCLHPIVQMDKDLLGFVNNIGFIKEADPMPWVLAMEYRRVANDYLSKHYRGPEDVISLSPLQDVNDMLIADKIQNKKDFSLYHKDTHPNSDVLYAYFNNWIKALGIVSEESNLLKCITGINILNGEEEVHP